MGLFSIFGTLKKKAEIESDKAAQKIEDSDPVGFAENDLKGIKKDLNTAQSNVAKMMAQENDIKDQISDLKSELESRTASGRKLKKQFEDGDEGKKALLDKVIAKIRSIKEELEPLEESLAEIQGHRAKHEANVEKLRKGKEDAERDIRSMKAMEQVTKSTEALAEINVGNSESKLASFKDRKKKMKMRLNEASALNDIQNSGDNLDAELDAALGDSVNDSIYDEL